MYNGLLTSVMSRTSSEGHIYDRRKKYKLRRWLLAGGQAGIAMSEHLSKQGISHLVVEKNRIAEARRTGRWDSLVANGPAWHDRFSGHGV